MVATLRSDGMEEFDLIFFSGCRNESRSRETASEAADDWRWGSGYGPKLKLMGF